MERRSHAGKPIFTRSALAIGVIASAVIAVVAAGAYLVAGDRYRLYTDPRAGHCWQALETLALSSSSLRPVRVDVNESNEGADISVDIEYRMDRVLGGVTLDASCVYPRGERETPRARSIALGGTALDADTLSSINAQIR